MSVRKSLLPTGCKNIFFLKKRAKKSGFFFEQKVLITKSEKFFFVFLQPFAIFASLNVFGRFCIFASKLIINKNIKYYGKNQRFKRRSFSHIKR